MSAFERGSYYSCLAYGQRITIAIVLPYKDKSDIVVFKSGWMVYPDGHIVLATPFSGVIK